jgi:membrane-associated phospholipid phosphatase
MSTTLILILLAATALMMIIERWGAPVVLELNMKGDIKRETRWLAQYGQAISTVVAALLVLRLDKSHPLAFIPLIAVPLATGGIGALVKRVLGRVRPRHEGAGKFLGPSWRHANWRESFPSNHSASAIAFTVVIAFLYPGGAEIFWTLAITCAVLRYFMDAHWPSDVLGGVLFGYVMGHLGVHLFCDLKFL